MTLREASQLPLVHEDVTVKCSVGFTTIYKTISFLVIPVLDPADNSLTKDRLLAWWP